MNFAVCLYWSVIYHFIICSNEIFIDIIRHCQIQEREKKSENKITKQRNIIQHNETQEMREKSACIVSSFRTVAYCLFCYSFSPCHIAVDGLGRHGSGPNERRFKTILKVWHINWFQYKGEWEIICNEMIYIQSGPIQIYNTQINISLFAIFTSLSAQNYLLYTKAIDEIMNWICQVSAKTNIVSNK